MRVPEPVTVASGPLVLLSLNMSMLAEPLTVMVVPFAPAVWEKAVNEAPSRRVALPEERMTLRCPVLAPSKKAFALSSRNSEVALPTVSVPP